MSAKWFDVREFEGRQGIIEIVDDEKGAWGNVGVGRIVFGDTPSGAKPPQDQPDFGTMCLALIGGVRTPPAEIKKRRWSGS